MNNKDILTKSILSQNSKFTVSDIAIETGISNPYVNQTVNNLMHQGLIAKHGKGKPQYWKVIGANKEAAPKMNVATKFEYIRNLVDMVISGVQPSVMITGQPGIGKSYLVKTQLNNADLVFNEDYLHVSGHSSPFGLYKALHDNRDSMIVFDDCDSVLKDDVCCNILKAALDSYDTRWVSWYSNKAEQEGLDKCFEFTGRIIFISNMFADKIDQAVRSRSFCFDLQMNNTEISDHMANILAYIEPNISLGLKEETLDYLRTIADRFNQYSLRTLIQAIRIRKYADGSNKDWKNMIEVLACDV